MRMGPYETLLAGQSEPPRAFALGRLCWVSKLFLCQGHYKAIIIHPG